MTEPLSHPRRTWHYLQRPIRFDVAPCACGNADTQWSEFEDHLWCDRCQIDFIPENYGILGGPISVELCRLLGIYFDRMNLETGNIEWYDDELLVWVTKK